MLLPIAAEVIFEPPESHFVPDDPNHICTACRSVSTLHDCFVCLAAGLAWPWAGVCAGEDDGGKAYRVTVGLVVLESEAPGDEFGQSEFYVSIDKQDPAAKQELERAETELKAVKQELERVGCLVAEREASGSDALSSEMKKARENLLASTKRRLGELRSRMASLEGKAAELRTRLRGRTSEVSVSGKRIHFAGAKLPLKVYRGDRVTISLWEADAFNNDLMGRKTFEIDGARLTAGGFQLNTGWVESLHLELVPDKAEPTSQAKDRTKKTRWQSEMNSMVRIMEQVTESVEDQGNVGDKQNRYSHRNEAGNGREETSGDQHHRGER